MTTSCSSASEHFKLRHSKHAIDYFDITLKFILHDQLHLNDYHSIALTIYIGL